MSLPTQVEQLQENQAVVIQAQPQGAQPPENQAVVIQAQPHEAPLNPPPLNVQQLVAALMQRHTARTLFHHFYDLNYDGQLHFFKTINLQTYRQNAPHLSKLIEEVNGLLDGEQRNELNNAIAGDRIASFINGADNWGNRYFKNSLYDQQSRVLRYLLIHYNGSHTVVSIEIKMNR
jgi:hypothetical protein